MRETPGPGERRNEYRGSGDAIKAAGAGSREPSILPPATLARRRRSWKPQQPRLCNSGGPALTRPNVPQQTNALQRSKTSACLSLPEWHSGVAWAAVGHNLRGTATYADEQFR